MNLFLALFDGERVGLLLDRATFLAGGAPRLLGRLGRFLDEVLVSLGIERHEATIPAARVGKRQPTQARSSAANSQMPPRCSATSVNPRCRATARTAAGGWTYERNE
jgi:hypothetical protein